MELSGQYRGSRRRALSGGLLAWAFALVPIGLAYAAANPAPFPTPWLDNPKAAGNLQTAVLAGGCFWGMQGVFEHVKGVRRVLAGYSGGDEATARYAVVGSGTTGHAESIQVDFDPAVVSYGDILRVYFSVAHDPTELNRQGPDEGARYRSAIFYADTRQHVIAQAYIAQLQRARVFGQPTVTRKAPSIQTYANTSPDRARRARHHTVLIGPVIRIDAQGAVWVVCVRRQEPRSVVLLGQR